ncbi:hypothetical protein N7533_003145 [Penicillium manginii]|uniref:uncharacterized protein n=1 Tax=Penicillium manginii TaxID=203109 RepID=UPI0025467FBE|nr:uncharacterized protein N7533_003145 [Penicillium manginii]KAJ5764464.1 hypothetical protein N7533_003145 [Penicillium manginii]
MSEFVPRWCSGETKRKKKEEENIMRRRRGIDCIVHMAVDNPVPPNLRNAMRQDKSETLKVISCS